MTYLTEEEAKTKWCPMARQLTGVVNPLGADMLTAANRSPKDAAVGKCIGSGCMMWREGNAADSTKALLIEAEGLLKSGRKLNAIKLIRQAVTCSLKEAKDIAEGSLPWPAVITQTGYCGLAGEPK